MTYNIVINDLERYGRTFDGWLASALVAGRNSTDSHLSESVIAQSWNKGASYFKGYGVSHTSDADPRRRLLVDAIMAFSSDGVGVSGPARNCFICEVRFKNLHSGDEQKALVVATKFLDALVELTREQSCVAVAGVHMKQIGKDGLLHPHMHVAVSPSGAVAAKELVIFFFDDRLV